MKKYLSLLSLMLLSLPLACGAKAHAVDLQTVDLGQLASGRPAVINLWFPQGNCPEQRSRFCLADRAVTDKTVVLSHGAMGASMDYAWLGEQLAAAGFVVVGVNHYGESRIYGAQTQDPRSSAMLWQRPQDVSALLDRLATEPLFQIELDWNRVIAIGHSSGGQTAAMLAGATFDLRALTAYCTSAAASADRSCRYGNNRAEAPQAYVDQFNAPQQDARIKKIVLMDPALGAAAQRQSLQAIRLPSLVIGAENNDFLPWENHGARYAAAIPQAKTRLLKGQEGHFVFLSPCTHPVRVMDVALCTDRPGVDRRAVHQELARAIVKFAQIDNEPAQIAPRVVRQDAAPPTN